MPESTPHTLGHEEFAALSAELIDNTGGLRFRAHGKSMRPSIHSGDILTLEKTDPGKLCIGDIVLIRNRSGSVLAHRIIAQDGGKWTTCGDALSTPDIPFEADQLIGRVCRVGHDGRDKKPSAGWGRFMAAVSRHRMSLWVRVLKRLFRSC